MVGSEAVIDFATDELIVTSNPLPSIRSANGHRFEGTGAH